MISEEATLPPIARAGINTQTMLEKSKVTTLSQQVGSAINIPAERIDIAKKYISAITHQPIEVKTKITEHSQVDSLDIGVGNISTTSAVVVFPAKQLRTETNELGKIIWHFSGKNQLRTVTLQIKDRTWQEEFARLRLPINPLLLQQTDLKPEKHKIIYETLCDLLEPVASSEAGNTVVLQGAPGLGKTYCAQYYFYHQAANQHQMVAWLPGSSKETFIQSWQALAQQLRNIDTSQTEFDDDTVIRNWCENQLGQWLFIIDDVNFESTWLNTHLPRRGGHVLVTTHQLDYELRQNQIPLSFSFLSTEDSKQLLQSYLGEYWRTTGHPEEEKALVYLSDALGGSPAALTQIAWLVRKKSLSFQRVMEQFKQPITRKLLLADTLFDQLKGQTFINAAQTGWMQLLKYFAKRYPQLHSSQHEQHLRSFINHLMQEIKIDSRTEVESPKVQFEQASVKAYWEAAWGPFKHISLETDKLRDLLSYLFLFFNDKSQQWQLSLAGLNVLKLLQESKLADQANLLSQVLPENNEPLSQQVSNDNETGLKIEATLTQVQTSIESIQTQNISDNTEVNSEIKISISMENSKLNHAGIAALMIKNPSELTAWQLPTINENFILRSKLINKLQQKLPNRKAGDTSAQLVLTAATGMGGVGKTELARYFITDPQLSIGFERRFWFTATTASQLRNQFYEFALLLGLIDKSEYIENQELITHIHKWLSIHSGWLIVLDNADNYHSIADWIPKEGGAVLVTTRDPNPGNLSTEQIVRVKLLKPKKAIEWLYLLSKRQPENMTEEEHIAAEGLVEDLGCLPLAIGQAAAHLREQSKLSIKEYYGQFKMLLADTALAQQAGKDLKKESDTYARCVVASTWKLSLQAIEEAAKARHLKPLAEPLLSVCAYLAPKNIPVLLLENFLKEFYQVDAPIVNYVVDEYIGQLVCYSLLERYGFDDVLSMHNLVQEVIINSLSDEKKQYHLLKSMAILIKTYPLQTIVKPLKLFKDYAQQRILLPHLDKGLHRIKEWVKSANEFTENKTELEKITSLSQQLIATILEFSAQGYKNLGNAQKAKQLLELALPIKEQHYGKSHPEVARTLAELANTLGDLGEPKIQKQLLTRALLIFKKHHGNKHPQFAATLNNLATAYGALGKAEQAKGLLKRALPIFKQHYGEEHTEIARILGNMAIVYRIIGDAKQAHQLLEDALAIDTKHYGKEHIEFASHLILLGKVFRDLGDFKQEKKLFEQALPIYKKYYGEDSLNIAYVLANLANAHSNLGDARQAKQLLEKVLEIQKQYYGAEHPDIAITLTDIAELWGDLGNEIQQKSFLEQALFVQEQHYKHYAKDHPRIAEIINHLAYAYGSIGDANQAIDLVNSALSIQNQYYGKDHIKLVQTLRYLANAYGALDNIKQAKQLLEYALKLGTKYYGENHSEISIILIDLAKAVGKTKYIEQIELLERALKIQEQFYGKEHPVIACTLVTLADVLAEDPNYEMEKQIKLLERALKIQEQFYGKEHPKVARTLVSLADAIGGNFKYGIEKQAQLLERALKIQEHYYGNNHVTVAHTLGCMATFNASLGKMQEAKQLYERILPIFENHYGENHSGVATVLRSLAKTLLALNDPIHAKEFLKRALNIQEQFYSHNLIEIGLTLSHLGDACRILEDNEVAKNFYERSLKIEEQHYGNNSPFVAATLYNFVSTYINLGDLPAAKNAAERAYQIFLNHSNFGPQHQYTQAAKEKLSIINRKLSIFSSNQFFSFNLDEEEELTSAKSKRRCFVM